MGAVGRWWSLHWSPLKLSKDLEMGAVREVGALGACGGGGGGVM